MKPDIAAELRSIREGIERLIEMIAAGALPAVMTKKRAAHELGYSVTTLGRRVRSGDLRLTKDGKVAASEVLRHAATGETKPVSKVERYSPRGVADKIRSMRVP